MMNLWHSLVASKYPNLASIPGPKPSFPLGNLLDLRGASALETSENLTKKYGPYALVWLANQPVVWIHDPRAIEEMLTTKSNAFFKDEPIGAMLPSLGAPNPFTSNGAAWSQTRRDSFLSDDRLLAWLDAQHEPARKFIERRLSRDLPFVDKTNIETWMFRLVFDLNCQMILGRAVPDDAFAAYNHVMDATDSRMSTNLPLLPRGFAQHKKTWLSAVADAVKQARSEPDGVSMAHYVGRFSRLSEEHQAGSLANMFPGGVFSVTATLVHLITQSSALVSLRDALPYAAAPYAALAACKPLERCIRESFRVAPPVPVFMRRVREQAVTVGRVTLDPSVRVIVGTAPLHRDADHWREPLAYKPERWTDDVLAANPFGSDYLFPFGRGPRSCHGEAMALFQIRSVLSSLLTRKGSDVRCTPPTSNRFYFGCAMPQGVRGTIR